MKKPLLIIVALLISVLSFSQQTVRDCNKYDAHGNKTGLWITQDRYRQSFTNYKNGKRDGVCYIVNTHYGTLCDFTRYSNGELVEVFTFLDETGVLLGREGEWKYYNEDGSPKIKNSGNEKH